MTLLTIKRQWFDMIVSGKKKEEYRNINPYYQSRLEHFVDRSTAYVRLKNGYNSNSPYVDLICTVTKGTGKPEWGAAPGVFYYVLKINKILKVGTK